MREMLQKSARAAFGLCDAVRFFNVSRGEKVFDYFEARGDRFVEFFGYVAAALGHVGLAAAFTADNGSYLSNDITTN